MKIEKRYMRSVPTLVIMFFITSCTYRYTTYGTYSGANTEYHAKKNYKMDVHAEVSHLCTKYEFNTQSMTAYCYKKPLQDLITTTLKEYNISANINDDASNSKIPTIEVYSNQKKDLLVGLNSLAWIVTAGIIPMKETIKYEVIFTKGNYKIRAEEDENHLTGWFLIPYSKKSDDTLVKGLVVRNMIRSLINQAIMDQKIESDFSKNEINQNN